MSEANEYTVICSYSQLQWAAGRPRRERFYRQEQERLEKWRLEDARRIEELLRVETDPYWSSFILQRGRLPRDDERQRQDKRRARARERYYANRDRLRAAKEAQKIAAQAGIFIFVEPFEEKPKFTAGEEKARMLMLAGVPRKVIAEKLGISYGRVNHLLRSAERRISLWRWSHEHVSNHADILAVRPLAHLIDEIEK